MLTYSRILLVAVFITQASCNCNDTLVKAPACYEGLSQACVTPCGDSKRYCRDGSWGECVPPRSPSPEMCNGVDDDCDGFTDEGLVDTRLDVPCGTQEGGCYKGRTKCIKGVVKCLGASEPLAEVCDGVDNDCNGVIDDVPEALCYSGPEGTSTHGVCHSGVGVCRGGYFSCVGEQTPEAPDCTDGQDHDCNGIVDGLSSVHLTDVVFAIDMSCSMAPKIHQVRQEIADFITKDLSGSPQINNLRMALIAVPGEMRTNRCGAYTDLLSPGEFLPKLGMVTHNNSGSEPTFDCPLGIVHPGNPFTLSFRLGVARVIFLITDEMCSSRWCYSPCGLNCNQWSDAESSWPLDTVDPRYKPLTVATVTKYAKESNTKVYVITVGNLYSYYNILSTSTGGYLVSSLSSTSPTTRDVLRGVLTNMLCE